MVRVLLVAIALIALIVQVDSDSMPWRMIMAKVCLKLGHRHLGET